MSLEHQHETVEVFSLEPQPTTEQLDDLFVSRVKLYTLMSFLALSSVLFGLLPNANTDPVPQPPPNTIDVGDSLTPIGP